MTLANAISVAPLAIAFCAGALFALVIGLVCIELR
jgi:hypothetical protein